MRTEWLDPFDQEKDLTGAVLRRRHEAAYTFARDFVAGGESYVVDIACGVGYGGRIVSDAGAYYAGLDRASDALRKAERLRDGPGTFIVADAVGGVPVGSDCADLVLAFQIIEHIPPGVTDRFLDELGRICKRDGHIIFTTPNRRHRLLPFQPPWNPYHEREFDRKGLAELLSGRYSEVSILGLRAVDDVEKVELARVRPDPLEVYTRPLRCLIPRSVRRWMRSHFSMWTRDHEEPHGGMSADQVSVTQFWVEGDPAGEGLDLIAVCRP